MQNSHHNAVVDFSLTSSGLFYKLLQRLNLAGTSTKDYLIRSLAICGATWLPLLVLSLLQGLAYGDKVEMTFLNDFATHTRFLVIIPLLIFAEGAVDFRLKELTTYFFTAGILDETDISKYDAIKGKIKKLSESVFADLVILLVVAVNVFIRWMARTHQTSYWMILPDANGETISWAGAWYVFFCIVIVQYILLRWIWRWVIWVIYFKKIAGMPLKLNPAHPDLAGGLGFLGMPPGPFLQVTLAFSVLFSTVIAERIVFLGGSLPQYYVVMGSFAVFCIILNVLPLLLFIPPLIRNRRRGIFEYSALIQEHHRQFDKKWLTGKSNEPMPGINDASTLTDFNSSFNTVMNMRVVPFNLRIMISSIIIAILPMLPLFAFEYNWLDLLKQIFGILF